MQPNKTPRPDDHKRMTIFFIAAAIIMVLSYVFITKPAMDKMHAQQAATAAAAPAIANALAPELKPIPDALKAEGKRIPIDNGKVAGSFATKGLRFDDIELSDYYTTLENTEHVRLLAPADTKASYFVEIGVLPADKSITVPDNDTQWKVTSGDVLSADKPVILEWNNGAGVTFRRTLSIDTRYVVTVTQSIKNDSGKPITVYPYGLISQSHHIPVKGEVVTFEDRDAGVQHIGPIAYVNDDLEEESYKSVKKEGAFQYGDVKGWLGMTSKYWLVGLLPQNDQVFDARIAHQTGAAQQDIYQVDMRMKPVVIDNSATVDVPTRFFAGAKKLSILTAYESELNIPKFDLSVDFGVLYLLTKPLYHFLTYLGNYFHDEMHFKVSFGIALLTLTILLRLVMFPLQNKAYRSMNRMKDLSPKLHALKEKYPDDKAKFQQEIMGLYKTEKVNPASGCLPILIQIPIFFALYKVIYITLDMRHAPFWGWIHDLSAPDPTNIFNLFGLLHFNTPAFLAVGAWPILYGITMWVQQALNPKPEDAMQQQIFAILPWVFTFVFAKFPAGLVIYYTWSNLLGIIQQYWLKKMHKKKPSKADA